MLWQRKSHAMFPVAVTAARRMFLRASLVELQYSRGPRGNGDGNYSSNGGGSPRREGADYGRGGSGGGGGGGGGGYQTQRRDGGGDYRQRSNDDSRRAPQRDYGDRSGSRYGGEDRQQVDRGDDNDRGRYGSRTPSAPYDRQPSHYHQDRGASSERDNRSSSFSSERRQTPQSTPRMATGYRSDRAGGPRSVDASNAEIRDAHNAVRESMGDPPVMPHRRPRVGDMAAVAKELVELKHRFKASKSKREMATLKSKSSDLLDALRIDMSTQDERSISIILNCAVFFHYSRRRFAIPDCVKWSLDNIEALSPQNVALFAHALGELKPGAWLQTDRALQTVLGVVSRMSLSKFSLVELIMLLQACAHANVLQFDDVQQELANDVVSRVKAAAASAPGTPSLAAPSRGSSSTAVTAGVKASDLSALLECAMLPQSIFARREPLKKATFEACAAFPISTGAVHSNNIVTLIAAFSAARSLGYAGPTNVVWLGLLQRAAEVAHFFSDEQLGPALSASVAARKCDEGAAAEAHDAFHKALCDRVNALIGKIPWHCVPSLLRGYHDAHLAFTEATAQAFSNSLIQELAWRGGDVRVMARSLAAAVALQDAALSSSGLYEAVAAHLGGARLARTQRAGKSGEATERDETAPLQSHDGEESTPSVPTTDLEKMVSVVALRFRRLTECRLHLERLNSSKNAARAVISSNSLANLSNVIREASKLCNASQLVRGLCTLVAYPSFEGRDGALDESLVALAEHRIQADHNLLHDVPKPVLQEFITAACGEGKSSVGPRPPIASSPRMKSLVEHAKRAAERNSGEGGN